MEESGASVYSGALRHRLQCPAVSFDLSSLSLFFISSHEEKHVQNCFCFQGTVIQWNLV